MPRTTLARLLADRSTRPNARSTRADPPSAQLTRAIAQGDPAAFAAFYDLWFDRAYALARSITGRDESFCLDVVQDCMLRVVKSMRALQDESAVAGWMSRALFTVAVDHLRRDWRRLRREQKAAALAPTTTEETPALQLEIAERNGWLAARLAEMSEADRSLLLERFAAGRTLQAAGAKLGISGDAAHGRIRRLLGRLRRAAKEFVRHD